MSSRYEHEGHDRKRRRQDQDQIRHESGPISTIHVSGLPPDVHERELRNLAVFLPGFEGASLCRAKTASDQIGFIKFSTQTTAMAAVHVLHNYQFDTRDPNSLLRISLAKRDMNIRRSNTTPVHQHLPYNAYGHGYNPYADGYGHESFGAPREYRERSHSTRPGDSTGDSPRPGDSTKPVDVPIESKNSGQSCNTLCMRGLTAQSSIQDVEPIYSMFEGYLETKFLGGMGFCFIRFQSKHDASDALDKLHGMIISIPGHDAKRPLLCEFAKRELELTEDRNRH